MQTSAVLSLRASRERFYVYGGLFAALALFMPLFIRTWLKMDLASRNWDSFRSAGATVGTNALLDPSRHMAWQAAHHHILQIFPYPPAVAWLYQPLAPLPASTGIAINALIVVAACLCAGLLAARIYMVPITLAVVAVFAWQPALDSMQSAENGAIVMLTALVAIFGIVRNRPIVAGIAVGFILLKPSIAIAFIVLLIARRQWVALAATAACAIMVYAASAAAAGGDWLWISTYARAIHTYYAADFARNQVAAITLPSLLMRAHVPVVYALAGGAAVLALSIPALARRSPIEAASMAPLVGLVASPHAWGYDGALILPALFLVIATLKDSLRMPIVAMAYFIGITQAAAAIVFGFNPLSAVLIIGTAAFLWPALHEKYSS